MEEVDFLAKLDKDLRRPKSSTKVTINDLERIEARDIADDGTLPDGSRVRFGYREHEIQPGRIMRRWFIECPECRGSCKVLYRFVGHFMCQRCTHLPFRSAVSGRSERAAMKLAKVPANDPRVSAIQLRLQRDCEHDLDYHEQKYREKMRKKRADRAATPPVARYELPDVDSFEDGS